jgi:hypothetical protein
MTSGARFLIDTVVVDGSIALLVGSCLFAWIKGGAAERWGALLYAGATLLTMGFELATGQSTPVVEELFLDTAEAAGFLALAVCYNNLWVGVAMMVKGMQLAIHATHLTDGEDPMFLGFNLYAAGLNLDSLLICLILAGGTFAAMRQRAKRRREAAAAPRSPSLREPRIAAGAR